MAASSYPPSVPLGTVHDLVRRTLVGMRECRMVNLALAPDGALLFAGRGIGLADLGLVLGLDAARPRDLLIHLSGKDLACWWQAREPRGAPYRHLRLTGAGGMSSREA